MWQHQYFQATNQWHATNVSNHDHQYQDGSGNLESFFGGSDQGGCCTANNGQGWPKYLLRSVFRTPADGGVAIGVFVPLRVQLTSSSVLLVDTDYPYEDTVTVLLTNVAKPTPLRIRVPTWATAATATVNGVPVPAESIANGTMLKVTCPAAAAAAAGAVHAAAMQQQQQQQQQQHCKLVLSLNPELRLESTYGSSVSVLRGPLLFSAFIGDVFHRYSSGSSPQSPCAPIGGSRGCGSAPWQPKGAQGMLNYTASIGMGEQQGWFGVTNGSAANLALVIADKTDLNSSFELVTPGLPCTVTPASASWPDCALSSPPTCERTCAAPFNHSAPFVYLKAKARLVKNWTFVQPGFLEAAPPPASPACSVEGACGETIDAVLVPHGSTNVRVGSLPLA
jgi:hypothetical protein